jgi:hypothetical protein
MSVEKALGSIAGSAFVVIGIVLLLYERLAYWYFDRSIKGFMEAEHRTPWGANGPTYEDWRPVLRWVIPGGFVVVGGARVGSCFAGLSSSLSVGAWRASHC